MEALLFPTSYVKTIVRDSLWPLGIQFTILTPTEKSPVIADLRNIEISKGGREEQKVRKICPVPLGEKLNTFEGIIRSYLTWAQHLDLGRSIHAHELEKLQIEDPESVQALIKSIKDEKEKDDLLYTQIFLELSLIFDIQHDSLDQDLSFIRKREELLHILMDGSKQEDSNPSTNLTLFRLPPMSQPLKRLSMWTELLSRLKSWDFFDVLLGEGQEIRDILDGRYEKLSNGDTAVELTKLYLNPQIKVTAETKNDIQEIFSQLVHTLAHSQDIPNEAISLSENLEKKWHTVQPKETPITLSVVHYKGTNVMDLLMADRPADETLRDVPFCAIALFIQ